MWSVCRHQNTSLIWISRRTFTIHKLNKKIQNKATSEDISYCDYLILQRKRGGLIKDDKFSMALTSIVDYVRNVKNIYNLNSRVRKFSSRRKKKIEALFSILLHSLHFACLGDKKRIPEEFQELSLAIPEEVENTINSKKSKKHRLQSGMPFQSPLNILKQVQKTDPHFQVRVNQLLSFYRYGQTDLYPSLNLADNDLLTNVYISAATFLSAMGEIHNQYAFEDIFKWISSILAQNVTDSCHSLTGLSKFPGFVIRDILLRNPTSEYEYDLMFELFTYFAKTNRDISEQVVTNMIQSSNRFKFSSLESILSILLDKSQALDNEMLNRLICLISNLRESKESREHYLSVLSAQRIIVDYILKKEETISPLGYLGIANGLLPLSSDRAKRFLNFAKDQRELTPEEKQLASVVSLKLSESPESLIQTFDNNSLDGDLSNDSLVWKELFQSLEKFELLDHENSIRFMKRLEHGPFHEAKTKLLPYRTLDDILKRDLPLNNRSLCTVLKKSYRSDESFEIFGTGSDFARHIFHGINSPDRSVVGTVLLEESYNNPKNAYNLYNKLLNRYCDSIPNEASLLSLIIPGYLDTKLKWENRFASQIAVHEFRKHCKRALNDSEGTIIPSNSLWKPYVKLLGRYSYQDELSDVLKIWEELKIVPDRDTLTFYLAALPDGIGKSKRNYAVRYLVPEESQELSESPEWDWPDEYEIDAQREIFKKR